MLFLINIFVMVTLLFILLVVATRNDFWTRLLGEVYHGIGIALIAGSIIGYFIAHDLDTLIAVVFLGGISLVIGIVLVLTSEAFLVEASKAVDIGAY